MKIDEQFYIVDVGSGINSFFEPMLFNFEPQKQMTGIYKFRLAQENEYFVERQRKKSINAISKLSTVYNAVYIYIYNLHENKLLNNNFLHARLIFTSIEY